MIYKSINSLNNFKSFIDDVFTNSENYGIYIILDDKLLNLIKESYKIKSMIDVYESYNIKESDHICDNEFFITIEYYIEYSVRVVGDIKYSFIYSGD